MSWHDIPVVYTGEPLGHATRVTAKFRTHFPSIPFSAHAENAPPRQIPVAQSHMYRRTARIHSATIFQRYVTTIRLGYIVSTYVSLIVDNLL